VLRDDDAYLRTRSLADTVDALKLRLLRYLKLHSIFTRKKKSHKNNREGKVYTIVGVARALFPGVSR
jgi:hypothetical protein